MTFSSISFLLLFLPVVMALYLIMGNRGRNYFLIIASIIFHLMGKDAYTIILIISIVMNYVFGRVMAPSHADAAGKKRLLGVFVAANLILLGVFKYAAFFAENLNMILVHVNCSVPVPHIPLPIGVSFFTFQAIAYLIDVYRGDVEPQKNFAGIAMYLAVFPKLVAGPIVRYASMKDQLFERKLSWDKAEEGVSRFITGLGKKVLIANNIAPVADGIFNTSTDFISTPYAWLGALAYMLQLYFDFSGYTDMAIGLGKIFGFNFTENFNYPYVSRSIRDFWRRWHITLSSWFRDYLYIPLGGNRKGAGRTYINLIIVFLLTGLWHGAQWTFVIWGIYHGIFLVIERAGFERILDRVRGLRYVYSFFVILIGWVFFRSSDISYAFRYLALMFSVNTTDRLAFDVFRYINSEFCAAMIVGLVFSAPLMPFIKKRLEAMAPTASLILRYCCHIAVLLLCILYLAKGSYSPFIYSGF